MDKKYKVLIRDIVIFGIGAIGSKFIMFLLLPLYTNVLSDSEYGVSELVFTIGQIVLPMISVAIYNGLLRYGLAKEYDRRDVFKCATLIFVFGSAVCFMVTPVAVFYGPIAPWRRYLCLYVVSNFAMQNAFVYLKVKDRNRLYAVLSIVQALLLVTCNVLLLVVLKLGVAGYLSSAIVSYAGIALLAFLLGDMQNDLRSFHIDWQLMRLMVVYSLPFIVNDISWWFIHSSDKIMIEWMLNSALLGIYTAAAKIPSLINAASSIFTQAWALSSIREFDSSNEPEFYSKVFKLFSIFIFGVCIVVIAVIKPFMSIYVGPDFYEAWHYVPLLLVSATFAAITSFAGSLYGAMKKSKNLMVTTLIAGLINIGVNYIFIIICGVWGAVIGSVAAYLVVSVLRLMDVHRFIRINYNLRQLIPLTVIVLTEAIFVGLDKYVFAVSIISIIAFICVANKELWSLVSMGKRMIKGKSIRGHINE